ncbi:MAG: NADH-quinone oxidoreductase subunit M [Candidatus Latescibacteria bacterium]|nr:NADH-quinone oxidoreductase subunit M [Candidatus Latescibacterota bacterium]
MGLLSWVLFFPLFGVLALLFIPKERTRVIHVIGFGVSVVEFFLSVPLYTNFRADTADMQFVEQTAWIPDLGVTYHVGIDGVSLFLVLMTTFLTAIAILASWTAITKRVKAYMISLLLLEMGMIGVFCALDLFLFFVFWEAMLVPMYLLIGVWGGERRIYAAVKFVLYTMAGSVLMFVAILTLYFKSGKGTFSLLDLYGTQLPFHVQYWLFLAFFFSFAIKVPLFPLHTWLPDAHVEAPTAGSVILAGVLLKMGTYGLIRFCLPLFPEAARHFTPLISTLAVIGILYGALVAMVQRDIKKLVAYSSVSHLGFVVLGIFAFNTQGMVGGMLQMINHGLSTGALFLIVGMIYERRHTRMIEEFGGLGRVIPVFSTFFMIVTLSSIGLPGLNGFVGEFLILVGAFAVSPGYAVVGASGIIFAAVYLLWAYQRMIFGEVTHQENRGLRDLTGREIAVLLPVVFFILWIGVYPKSFLNKMEVSAVHVISQVSQATGQDGETVGKETPVGSRSGWKRRSSDVLPLQVPTENGEGVKGRIGENEREKEL